MVQTNARANTSLRVVVMGMSLVLGALPSISQYASNNTAPQYCGDAADNQAVVDRIDGIRGFEQTGTCLYMDSLDAFCGYTNGSVHMDPPHRWGRATFVYGSSQWHRICLDPSGSRWTGRWIHPDDEDNFAGRRNAQGGCRCPLGGCRQNARPVDGPEVCSFMCCMLDLRSMKIETVPHGFGIGLGHLETLILVDNLIQTLPDDFGLGMSNLKTLSFGSGTSNPGLTEHPIWGLLECKSGWSGTPGGEVCTRCGTADAIMYASFAVGLVMVAVGFWLLWRVTAAPDSAREEVVLDAIDLGEEVVATVATAQLTAGQLAITVKIVTGQVQQCLGALMIRLHWPALLLTVKQYLVGLVDIGGIVPLACLSGDGAQQSLYSLMFLLAMGFCLIICVYILRRRGDADSGVHLMNFSWAVLTITLASLAAHICTIVRVFQRQKDMSDLSQKDILVLIVPASIILGALALMAYASNTMRNAREESRLRSPGFEARYSWLCARYTEKCYYWELLYCLARSVSIMIAILADPTVAIEAIIAITLLMLTLQLTLKPFNESEDAARSWRTSPNQQAVLAYACSLVVMFCGLIMISVHTDFDARGTAIDTVVCLVCLIALFLPLGSAIYLTIQTVEEIVESKHVKRTTKNAMHDTDESDEEGRME